MRWGPSSRDHALDFLLDGIEAHPRRSLLVFSDSQGKMLTKGGTKAPLENALKRAGLRHIGWHALRHTFASHLVMRGAPIKAVQELLGHSTIEMTMRYSHLSPDARRDAVRMLGETAAISVEAPGIEDGAGVRPKAIVH